MPRSRSRSRSPRGGREQKNEDKKEEEPAKPSNSEQEIVTVAIKQLPGDIRERLEKLFEEGLLKEGDLDLRSITVFASLNEGLQARVMNHMEGERIYVANARSKSGFLIATCDKAKTGCLDARGLGAIDPWRTALVAMATPKQAMIDLKPERDWLDSHDDKETIKINVNVSKVEDELGMPTVTVELPLTDTSSSVKAKLVAMGVKSLVANRMRLHTDPVGFLKERFSFAYYNLEDGVTLTLSERKRAGVRFKSDHTVMPKRPRTQPAPGQAPPAAVPGLPAPPGLPALPAMPAGTGPGTAPAAMPGLPGMTMPGGLPGMPPGLALPGDLKAMMAKLGGTGPGAAPDAAKAPSIAQMMSDLAKAKAGGGLPGLPPPGSDPKAAALAMMAKMGGGMPGLSMPGMSPPKSMPGMSMPGGMPGMSMPGGMPGMSMPGGMPGMSMPGGMPGMSPPGGMPGMSPPGGMPGMSAPGGTPGSIPGMNIPGMKMPGMNMPGLMGGPGKAPGMMPPGLSGPAMAKGDGMGMPTMPEMMSKAQSKGAPPMGGMIMPKGMPGGPGSGPPGLGGGAPMQLNAMPTNA